MGRNPVKDRVWSSSTAVAKATMESMYEFVRALATLLVGGLFMFYSYITAVGVTQSASSGMVGQTVAMFAMFLLAFGSMVYFVGIINGVIEDPIM